MIYKIAASLFVALVFSSVNVTFRHEINKKWGQSIRESIPLFLAMIAMIAIMMITNYVHSSKITLMMTGVVL